jgi:hypothetical protein
MFLSGMTRGEMLKYAIAFALRRARKIVRGLKDGLTEDERFAVADHRRVGRPSRVLPPRLGFLLSSLGTQPPLRGSSHAAAAVVPERHYRYSPRCAR